MARRRQSVVGGLSASAVDLLSCGLAAAAVLWLLVLPNSGYTGYGDSDRVNGMVRFSQFGAAHLHGANGTRTKLTVAFPSDVVRHLEINAAHGQFSEGGSLLESRLPVNDGQGDPGKVLLDISKRAGFAAQVAIVFRNVKPRTSVILRFEPCQANFEPHAVTLITVDRRGARNELIFWQHQQKLNDALSPGGTPKAWFPSLIARLKSDPASYMGTARREPRLTRLHTYEGTGPIPVIILRITATESGSVTVRTVGFEDANRARAETGQAARPGLFQKLRDWCDHFAMGSCT